MEKERVLAYSVAQYLQGLKEKGGDSPQTNSLEAACHSLESMFGFSLSDPQCFRELSFCPTGLDDLVEAGREQLGAEIYQSRFQKLNSNPKFPVFVETVAKRGYFDGADEGSVEYLKRHAKVAAKFQSKMETTPVVAKEDNSSGKSNREQLAEEKKAAGNAAIAKKNYEEAIALYSEALALSASGPNSHIYYSNRAAAYCHLNNYQQAASDCERSVALNSTYVKAYSRLGLARFFLNQYQESIAAYERAVELEPSNKSHSDALKQAKQKLEEQNKRVAASPAPSPATGGMPDLASLAGMMGGAGGGGGLASMLQNPQMMQMAQQMMQNPQLMQQAMSMLGGSGGAGGGMPDMSALASMFGGAAGGGGAGSGGNAGGVPSFSGLVDENNR
jgi:small glutamine-rich tetratricopeptide repeat-containing protein alpha